MRELLSTIDAWRAEGLSLSRAVVVRTFGSSPRREGATMVRGSDGRISGSVSGGCVEGATAEHMAAAAASGEQRLVRFGISDSDADAALVEFDTAAVSSGTSTVVELAGRQLFVESFPVRPRLVVVGAVEVAVALVRLGSELGYETVLIDGRPAFATRERFPHVDQLVIGWPDEVADELQLGRGDAVAVLSHDPKFDDPAITAALRHECRYVGAIGSRKTQRARRERLAAAGLSEEQLARLRGPIGLDLGGREPAETALAIMSEVVAARHGASGGSLAHEPASGRP